MLTGILEDNGKEIPSNYEATDFWPEILYSAQLAIKCEDRLMNFSNRYGYKNLYFVCLMKV